MHTVRQKVIKVMASRKGCFTSRTGMLVEELAYVSSCGLLLAELFKVVSEISSAPKEVVVLAFSEQTKE